MTELVEKKDALGAVWGPHLGSNEKITIKEATDRIKKLPPAYPVTGKWIEDDAGYFYCSVCGKKPEYQVRKTDFCPDCGSRNYER